jgi:hypothetical protein
MDRDKKRKEIQVQTVFGESPDPIPERGKKPERKLDPETAGLIRGFILVTGAFITIALLLIWLKYYPTTPDLPAIPSTGEYERLLAADEAKLNNYSWLNQRSGIVRIPIKEAMKIVAEEGLPARQMGEDSAAEEGVDAEEGSSVEADESMTGEEGLDSEPPSEDAALDATATAEAEETATAEAEEESGESPTPEADTPEDQ